MIKAKIKDVEFECRPEEFVEVINMLNEDDTVKGEYLSITSGNSTFKIDLNGNVYMIPYN